MVECDNRLYAAGDQSVDEVIVESNSLLVDHVISPIQQDESCLGDGETVDVNAARCHQVSVLRKPIVVVACNVPVLTYSP